LCLCRDIGRVSLVEYIRAKEQGKMESLKDIPNHYNVSFDTLQVPTPTHTGHI
jgi:hypothetical protein